MKARLRSRPRVESRIVIATLLLLGAVTRGDVGRDYVISRAQQESIERHGKDTGSSVAPVVGYDPTYKLVLGGAYFYNLPTFSIGVDVNTNFKRVYQAHLSLSHRFAPEWEYGLRSSVTQGFDPFYGEGGETLVGDYLQLWGLRMGHRFHVAYKPSGILSFGAFGDGRYRTEVNEFGGAPTPRRFPDERTLGLGGFWKIDTRKERRNPTEGFVFGVAATYVPRQLSTVARNDFGQLESDFIVYKAILDEVIPDVIAAFHLMAGYTIGDPTYEFEYRLGGAGRLRGYLDNRFRGKKYYLQQTELRFPIWKLFSGAAFLGFGDATNGNFTNPKLAYGLGLRIGLPPDWISRVRIDWGFGRDQNGIFADFGHTF